MNKFMKDLEKELNKLNVNSSEIKEILEDHKEMIEAAKEEGLNDDEMILKFGDPVKVASEINADLSSLSTKIITDKVESLAVYDINSYTFLKSFSTILGLEEIDISLVSSDFTLCESEEEGIQVYYKNIKDIDKFDINLDDGTFTLKRKSNLTFGKRTIFGGNDGKFLVLIPEGLNLKNFNYHTVSGDVAFNKVQSDKFKLKSTSGDIKISNVIFGSTKLTTVNGDIEISGVETSSLDISLINGDIKLKNIIVDKDILIHSVSGDAKVNDVECNKASFKTVSGDIKGRNFYVNEITLKSVSGDIEIDNDDKSRFIKVVSKKTVSGDININ